MTGQATLESSPTMSPDEIRAGIRKSEQKRRKADLARQVATDELTGFLRAAQDCPDVTIIEAAELAGVTRNRVYELLRESDSGAKAV